MISNLFTQKGHSLIELMVAMSISAIIATGTYGIFNSQQRIFRESEQVIEMQRNSRIALNKMQKDIRMAGYNPKNILDKITVLNPSGFKNIIKATSSRLTFDLDLNEDGITESISYFFNSDTGELLRGNAIIADNITDFSFNYYLIADSTSTSVIKAAKCCDGSSSKLLLTQKPQDYGLGYIRGVEINITYLAKRPDPNYTNPDGVNGHYRTLSVTLQVNTRNIGRVV